MNAAANIFLGMDSSPLAVKPYLSRVSDAQMFAIMVSGLASVAGTVLLAYAQMGAQLEYLLAACFMSAPGGLLMAKIIMPDDSNNDSGIKNIDINATKSPHTNFNGINGYIGPREKRIYCSFWPQGCTCWFFGESNECSICWLIICFLTRLLILCVKK
jgi:nucleoside permease NupC